MTRREKPEHVVARQNGNDTDNDTGWLDEPTPAEKRAAKPDKDELTIQGGAKRTDAGHSRSKHRRPMTDMKWKKFLELAANGLRRKDALKVLKLTKETFDAHLIESVAAGKQLREADAAWVRRSWPIDQIEEILVKMSLGITVKAAAIKLGYDEERLGSFYELVRKDNRIREMYDIARELQAEAWMDDNIDISDNRGGDTFTDLKGNRKTDHAIIQRDALRIQTRQWTMSALNRKRFGEHKHIDHSGEIQVNHAVQLSNARKRLEQSRQSVTVDNATQEVVSQ